jgi:hypothetical protein
MRTAPFLSNGNIICRLQRRHLISTPSATMRASKLPQQQRSEIPDFTASPDLFC